MVFACSSGPGLRLVGEETDRIVSRLAAKVGGEGLEPRYFAKGRFVVTAASGRQRTTPVARGAANHLLESALAVSQDEYAETDIRELGDLIRAIRAAERNDLPPTPQAVRAAA